MLKYWLCLIAIVGLVIAGLIFKTKTGGVNVIFFFALIALGWAFLLLTNRKWEREE